MGNKITKEMVARLAISSAFQTNDRDGEERVEISWAYPESDKDNEPNFVTVNYPQMVLTVAGFKALIWEGQQLLKEIEAFKANN